ncbi:hypothetical protein U1Q18_010231 [Sarracenia purpurea var. burkii]
MSQVGDPASRVSTRVGHRAAGLINADPRWAGRTEPDISWEASSHPCRILMGGEGGPTTELTSNLAVTTGGLAPPTMGMPAVLALFEEARLGAELIGRALSD